MTTKPVKRVTMIPTTLLSYEGRSYAANHQFEALPEDAEAFIKSGQAFAVREEKPADKADTKA